ncbi:MAG: monofunctional biosynthetic peptidoglycan transglycosylase [Chitinophagaceae bacterium]|jgi:monofunctional biosynthetic peptidoglycan transglycosylase|nr:monofunctional biosynthetic peptidoglycan transglycosylase [Chitinophagaceae bacterium]
MKKVFKFLKRLALWLVLLHFAYILYVWVFPPPITLTQLGSLLGGHGLHKDWVSYEEMSPQAALAVMAAEDQLFPDHNGFDWKSIEKAMAYNKRKPGRVRGASTISQQVAKNVFLWQGRSYVRKGLEVYFTFVIEALYSKQRIMELYLNVAEMGEGTFGIEAASQRYFGKPASRLSRAEAAKIAAALPNPKKYSVKPLSSYVSRRSAWIQRQMNNLEGDPDVQRILKR